MRDTAEITPANAPISEGLKLRRAQNALDRAEILIGAKINPLDDKKLITSEQQATLATQLGNVATMAMIDPLSAWERFQMEAGAYLEASTLADAARQEWVQIEAQQTARDYEAAHPAKPVATKPAKPETTPAAETAASNIAHGHAHRAREKKAASFVEQVSKGKAGGVGHDDGKFVYNPEGMLTERLALCQVLQQLLTDNGLSRSKIAAALAKSGQTFSRSATLGAFYRVGEAKYIAIPSLFSAIADNSDAFFEALKTMYKVDIPTAMRERIVTAIHASVAEVEATKPTPDATEKPEPTPREPYIHPQKGIFTFDAHSMTTSRAALCENLATLMANSRLSRQQIAEAVTDTGMDMTNNAIISAINRLGSPERSHGIPGLFLTLAENPHPFFDALEQRYGLVTTPEERATFVRLVEAANNDPALPPATRSMAR